MPQKRKPQLSQEEQSRRFIEGAREAGVPDDVDLERMVRQIAKAPPPKTKKPRRKR